MKFKEITFAATFVLATTLSISAFADKGAYYSCKSDALGKHVFYMGVALFGAVNVTGMIKNIADAQKCYDLLTKAELEQVLKNEAPFNKLKICPNGPLCPTNPHYMDHI